MEAVLPLVAVRFVAPRNDRALATSLGRTLQALAIAGTVAIFGGCPPHGDGERDIGTLPRLTSDDPQAEAAMRDARAAADAGDLPEAERRYRAFLERFPRDPLRPLAQLGLGRVLLATDKVSEARPLFAEVAQHPDSTVAERGRFYDGIALHLEGHHRESLDALRPFVGRTIDPEETSLLLSTIAAASEHTGDRMRAIEALDMLARAQVDEEDRNEALTRIHEIVDGALTPEEAWLCFERMPRDGAAFPHCAQKALRQAYEANDMARVRVVAEALNERGIELDDQLQAMALRAERTDTVDTGAIGAVLPLTGRSQEVGQRALKGLMLAAGGAPTGPIAPDAARVVFRDYGGDPERAVRAVEDLVSLHRVIAIVGPMEGEAATRAARRAQELGVPLIALTPADGVTNAGPMVFRLFLTPRAEAHELVAAARARGATRFAILHPETPFGIAMRDAFNVEVRAQGGQVTSTRAYQQGATAFGADVAALAAQPFDAVFVPDASRTVALIAPALAAAGLWSTLPGSAPPRGGRAITILAPSVGFDAELARTSGRYLQGAIFSQPFHAPTATGAAREFADRYLAQYGSAPDGFSAAGYDAFRLVRGVVERGATTRAAVAERLRTTAGADTAGPSGGFRADREPARGTRLLELRGTAFMPLEAPPPAPVRSSATGSTRATRDPIAAVRP